MKITIIVFWRLFVHTDKISFAESVSREIQERIKEISPTKVDHYWKDDSLCELEFKQLKTVTNIEDFLFQVLEDAASISNNWQLSIPQSLRSNYDQISGITEGVFKINGLKWGSFTIGSVSKW